MSRALPADLVALASTVLLGTGLDVPAAVAVASGHVPPTGLVGAALRDGWTAPERPRPAPENRGTDDEQ